MSHRFYAFNTLQAFIQALQAFKIIHNIELKVQKNLWTQNIRDMITVKSSMERKQLSNGTNPRGMLNKLIKIIVFDD